MTQQQVINPKTSAGVQTSTVSIASLSFEHHRENETIGIGETRPRLSWIVTNSTNGWHQASYEIELYQPNGQLTEQTGRVESDQSVLLAWPFSPLSSRERVEVRVRVRGTQGQVSDWSKRYPLEIGLLEVGDWTARFITPAGNQDSNEAQPSPLFRKEFEVGKGLIKARLYITALGLYEAQLNGIRFGDQILSPGWTSYQSCLRNQTFDVTNQLREGRNVIGAMLGEGWYS